MYGDWQAGSPLPIRTPAMARRCDAYVWPGEAPHEVALRLRMQWEAHPPDSAVSVACTGVRDVVGVLQAICDTLPPGVRIGALRMYGCTQPAGDRRTVAIPHSVGMVVCAASNLRGVSLRPREVAAFVATSEAANVDPGTAADTAIRVSGFGNGRTVPASWMPTCMAAQEGPQLRLRPSPDQASPAFDPRVDGEPVLRLYLNQVDASAFTDFPAPLALLSLRSCSGRLHFARDALVEPHIRTLFVDSSTGHWPMSGDVAATTVLVHSHNTLPSLDETYFRPGPDGELAIEWNSSTQPPDTLRIAPPFSTEGVRYSWVDTRAGGEQGRDAGGSPPPGTGAGGGGGAPSVEPSAPRSPPGGDGQTLVSAPASDRDCEICGATGHAPRCGPCRDIHVVVTCPVCGHATLCDVCRRCKTCTGYVGVPPVPCRVCDPSVHSSDTIH